ncbi:MAG TPA: cytochrome c [Ilumatobacteraceae bacterium]|nr:cytochrome c [Ilumatobacteraceae bacterium]
MSSANSRSRLLITAGVTLIMAVGAVACGDDAGTAGDSAATGLSNAAQNGERLSRSSGCAGCHGQNFEGGAGPGWIGLAGSQVTLVDGSTLLADDAYLTAAIADPSKHLVDGYTLKMPANNLTDAEVADIVAYINTLADE